METLIQDLRFSLRLLLKNPGFTLVAVLTLALGIGANTAIFSIVNAVLLRTLPVPNPRELVILGDPDAHGMATGSNNGERELFSYHEFEQLRDQNQAFSSIFAAASFVDSMDGYIDETGSSDHAEPVKPSLVSGAFFSVLGAKPILGRTFTQEVDKVPGVNPVAVISYDFWKRRFGRDPSVLGRTVRIRQTTFEIIGVTGPGFFGETVGESPDLWVPLSMQMAVIPGRNLLVDPDSIMERTVWIQSMGRLRPGVSLDQAKASINVTLQQMLQTDASSSLTADQRKDWMDQRIGLTSAAKGASTLRGRFTDPLRVLMGLVGLVLLIACANVANLLLSRATMRQKEIAMRLALGARRSRLVRQLLTESILLALVGGGVGLVLAQWANSLLVRLASSGPDLISIDLHPDARILGFTVVLSTLTGILFGLMPSLRSTRFDLSSILKASGRSITADRGRSAVSRMPVGKILVVAQVSISLLLLVVAGLFVRSFQKLVDVDLGYKPDKFLLFRINPLQSGYKGAALLQFHQTLREKIAAIPGVQGVTLSENGLFSHTESADPIWVEGYTPKTGADKHARFDQVGPHYFSTVGIPVLMGRDVDPRDGGNGPRVGWINQTMARFYFPNTTPLGKHIRDEYPDNPGEFEIVGVVADAKYNSLRETTPRRFYVPFFNPITVVAAANFEIRTRAEPAAVAAALREVVKSMDRSLPTLHVHTMTELVDQSLARERLITSLSGLFGGLAVLLASIGLYGVMAFAVARRTNEIGIRMALGAQRRNVLGIVMRETMVLVLLGIGVGLPVVFATTRLLSKLLFGLTPVDPATIFMATMAMVSVAALAGYLPAHRASRVDPMVSLRYE